MSEMTEWEESCREKALLALEAILAAIPGVRYVNRQAISSEMVADSQLPAILIEEVRTQYRWVERFGRRRVATLSSILVLGLELQAKRHPKAPGLTTSSAREAMVEQVLKTLVDNPTLKTHLSGEAEAVDHARDIASALADVTYPDAPAPKARALITIRVDLDAEYDGRTRTAWERLVLDLRAFDEVDAEDSYEPAITIDVTANT